MSSHRDLFPRLCSFENLHRALREARRGKRGREEVAAFEYDAEKNLLELQAELLDGGYHPGPYRHFWIRDPKRKKTSAAQTRTPASLKATVGKRLMYRKGVVNG